MAVSTPRELSSSAGCSILPPHSPLLYKEGEKERWRCWSSSGRLWTTAEGWSIFSPPRVTHRDKFPLVQAGLCSALPGDVTWERPGDTVPIPILLQRQPMSIPPGGTWGR